MNAFRAVGSVMLYVALLIITMFVVILMLRGTLYVSTVIYPYLILTTSYVMPICGMILFPLSAFKRTRDVAVTGIYICSFLFGAVNWVFGFLVSYDLWGFIGIFIGLFIAGVGVVPVGAIASAWNGEWVLFWNLIIGAVITYGARFYALYKIEQIEKEDCEAEMLA